MQLWLAAVLHSSVASKKAWARMLVRRNLALKAARKHGVPVEVMADRLDLKRATVRDLVRDPQGEAEKAAGLKVVPPLDDEQPPAVGE